MKSLYLTAAVTLTLAAHPALAAGTYDPGATDTTIKLGNTFPWSGPVSVTVPQVRQMIGYFNMINDQGGVNGRKITFISYDDGYLPPKTVEMTRKLVESDGVFFLAGSVGTPTNTAVWRYMNENKAPQLFPATGATERPQRPPLDDGVFRKLSGRGPDLCRLHP